MSLVFELTIFVLYCLSPFVYTFIKIYSIQVRIILKISIFLDGLRIFAFRFRCYKSIQNS